MPQADASSDHFDMLPFIAILMCVLGCLLLVTVSMSAVCMGVGAGEVWIPAGEPPGPRTTGKFAKLGVAALDNAGESREVLIPILVEWDGKNAIFHLEEGRRKVAWEAPRTKTVHFDGNTFEVPDESTDARARDELRPLIEKIAERKKTHYALIAVRPSGFGSLDRFLRKFRAEGVTIGYEPIDQSRPVNLAKDLPPAPKPAEPPPKE